MMRTLIYVPVIHTSADLGSLAGDITRRGISDLGEDFWKKHQKTVEDFWDVISNYFDSIDVSGMKIYQDGMIAEGEVGEKIVEEGRSSGSNNYELVSRLLKKAAILVRTEDFYLVKEEYDRLRAIIQAKSIFQKLSGFMRYKLVKTRLLNKRDQFIAQRINETLSSQETGILFIGASHGVKNLLAQDIQIKEVKEVEKVREYQQVLPFCHKHKQRFEELGRYLVSRVEMEMSLFGEIKKVISEQLGVQPEEIGPKTSLIADLGADSLDTVELVMALEERFRIEIPGEDVERMKTAGDVVSYVESKMR